MPVAGSGFLSRAIFVARFARGARRFRFADVQNIFHLSIGLDLEPWLCNAVEVIGGARVGATRSFGDQVVWVST